MVHRSTDALAVRAVEIAAHAAIPVAVSIDKEELRRRSRLHGAAAFQRVLTWSLRRTRYTCARIARRFAE
jgi:hypothetical protein